MGYARAQALTVGSGGRPLERPYNIVGLTPTNFGARLLGFKSQLYLLPTV